LLVTLPPQLSICCLIYSDALAHSLKHRLQSDAFEEEPSGQYDLVHFMAEAEFLSFIQRGKQPDCLILQDSPELLTLLKGLRERATLLPTIILELPLSKPDLSKPDPSKSDLLRLEPSEAIASKQTDSSTAAQPQSSNGIPYHTAVLRLSTDQLHQLAQTIDQAIDRFLTLSLSCPLPDSNSTPGSLAALHTQTSLVAQQKRLSDKLKERLGYLGVYYKRNPQNFLRHMAPSDRRALIEQLKEDYREIILNYFARENSLNEKIDGFVNMAFFADISVSTIVEIHMELMDEFSKQLQLEGRSDDILLDYRLTLIDAIAHLCEMYRRSIPRES
jgi:circadian clock protein KaiA